MKKLIFDDINIIISLYNFGKSLSYISNEFSVSKSAITSRLIKNCIKIRNDIYSIDENYFENINTETKAYLLGYLFSDGTVRYNKFTGAYRFKLKIHKKDIHILEFLKNKLNCDNPIKMKRVQIVYI